MDEDKIPLKMVLRQLPLQWSRDPWGSFVSFQCGSWKPMILGVFASGSTSRFFHSHSISAEFGEYELDVAQYRQVVFQSFCDSFEGSATSESDALIPSVNIPDSWLSESARKDNAHRLGRIRIDCPKLSDGVHVISYGVIFVGIRFKVFSSLPAGFFVFDSESGREPKGGSPSRPISEGACVEIPWFAVDFLAV